MFTNKDIEYRSIFVINCIEKRELKVSSGELLLKNGENGETLTKFPFQKLLALFIIGHITITTPLIDKCKKHGVFISVMKPNLRPVFTYGHNAEANFLLRERQYKQDSNDLRYSKRIVINKITNQALLLKNTRRKDELTIKALNIIEISKELIKDVKSFRDLMGVEGLVAKEFFSAYFQDCNWIGRMPRTKCDIMNVTLDIGYTILFNFMESFIRMFGFDLYQGVYHRQWFKRKSLVCDLMEPFRCIIDRQVRKSFSLKQFKEIDFGNTKGEYYLKRENNAEYYKTFFDALIKHKQDIFLYVRQYYRAFMTNNPNSMQQFQL